MSNKETEQAATYTPEHLKRWTLPPYYVGAEWPEYYRFLGRNRDSDIHTNSNFDAGLKAIGGERTIEGPDGEDLQTVLRVSENHWACGWVEWIAIHESDSEALRLADEVMERLEDYPLLDEEDVSQREEDEAERIWNDCYTARDKVEAAAKERDYMRVDTPVWVFGRWNYNQLCAAGGKDYPHPLYRIAERLRDHLRESAR